MGPMSMFGKIGDMYKLQKQAKKLKKELAKMHIFSESNGVKVTVSGEQEVVSVEFLEGAPLGEAKKLSRAFIEATNKAGKKAQQISAEKMQSVMGGLGGLMGGQ